MMEFVLKPSLEHLTLVKIVVSLCSQNDVRALIAKIYFHPILDSNYKEWEKIEERVIEKVPYLSLPQLLKEKVISFVKPIMSQTKEWMEFHRSCFHFRVNLPAELCWTPQGTVDRKRTAEELVKDENLDISTRYKLACIYCLEDDIHKFWNNVPVDLKNSEFDKFPMINFWSYNMKRRELGNVICDLPSNTRRGWGNEHISYKSAFHQCARTGNKVATEYFLQKLAPQEREESLVEAAKHANDDDTLYFLISEMNEEQQMEVFKHCPCSVLQSFLEWPRQSFFIGVANCMWDFISTNKYDFLLLKIIEKVREGYKNLNYEKLFTEFWQESPISLRSLFTEKLDEGYLLQFLLRIKDKEKIKLIFKDATLTAKEKLIYNDEINDFCKCSIQDNEWDFLEFCIRECFPSKNEMLKFKEEFEKNMSPYFKVHFATKKQKWDQLFRLSDGSICKCDKRSLEEGESSSSKQFRSLQ